LAPLIHSGPPRPGPQGPALAMPARSPGDALHVLFGADNALIAITPSFAAGGP
jgi:hypothetical protein